MSIHSKIALLVVGLVMALAAQTTWAQQDAAATSKPHAPVGYLLIEEDQWNQFADEPGRHLGRARDAFLVMDANNAAAEIRKAEVHLKVAADHARERTKRALVQSERELEHIARRIEQGTFKSIEEFDLAASRALHALSNDQYAKATEAWRKRDARQTGQYLRASVDNLERAAARTDATMRQATAVVVKDTRLISGKLIEGTGYVIDEVGSGFEKVGHAIERVGTRVEPGVNR